MADKKFEILKRETMYQGYFRMDRYHLRYERFDGSWSRVMTREVLDRGRRCAGVLPFDPQQDKVVLVEQFRPGVMARDEYPWTTELVAGVCDTGETCEMTARREASEEAGCVVTDLCPLMDYFPSPGSINEYTSLYVGRTIAPEHESLRGLVEEDEDTRVLVLPTAEALNLLYAKKIRDAATIITMQWFALHHTELRSRWLVSEASTPLI